MQKPCRHDTKRLTGAPRALAVARVLQRPLLLAAIISLGVWSRFAGAEESGAVSAPPAPATASAARQPVSAPAGDARQDSAKTPAPPTAADAAALPPSETARKHPLIGTAERVLFSEFNRDTGALVLELEAKTAAPTGLSSAMEPVAWSLGGVLLRFYENDSTGEPRPTATLITKDCLYTKDLRVAETDSELEFDSAKFRVEGTGWRWRDERVRDTIQVHRDVRATLKADIRENRERTDIFSKRLEIIRFRVGPEQGRAMFVFSGDVRAVMRDAEREDVMLFADTLVVRLKNTDRAMPASGGATAAAAATPTATAPLAILSVANEAGRKRQRPSREAMLDNTLESIVLSGNVRILSEDGREMTGKISSYDHSTGVFTTSGDAYLSDTVQRFTATGGQMLLRLKQGQIEVLREPAVIPSSAAAANPANARPAAPSPPVRLQIPSVIDRDRDKRGRAHGGGDGLTTLTGERLVISRQSTVTRAVFTGETRATDENFVMNADRISVEIPARPKTAPSAADGAPDAKNASADTGAGADNASAGALLSGIRDNYEVRRVVAEGRVHATHEDSVMDCERVILNPGSETIELEGAPRLAIGAARLTGHKVEMDMRRAGNRSVRVFSSPPPAVAQAPKRAGQPGKKTPDNPSAAASPASRATITLPPQSRKPGSAPPPGALLATEVRATAGTIFVRETDRQGKEAVLRCTGGVTLDGGGLQGRCDELDVEVDGDAAIPATRPGTLQRRGERLSRIRKLTATGHVHFATERYAAAGGQAVLHPNVALTENSVLEDNGLDGASPQFLLLLPHASTPGQRPRITHTPKAAASGGTAETSPAGLQKSPMNVTGDRLEIVGGAMRSRFFLDGNTVLTGDAFVANCDKVEGVITQEPKARSQIDKGAGGGAKTAGRGETPAMPRPGAKSAQPEIVPTLSHLVGRGHVRIQSHETEATGEKFEYRPAERKIHLLGSPSVKRRDGFTTAGLGSIIFDSRTGEWQSLPTAATETSFESIRPTVILPTSRP